MRVTHKLECPIDEAEIQNAKDALARQTVEYNRLADEEKERAAKARADLKARDEEIGELAARALRGVTKKEVKCEARVDPDRQKLIVVRLDTGKEVPELEEDYDADKHEPLMAKARKAQEKAGGAKSDVQTGPATPAPTAKDADLVAVIDVKGKTHKVPDQIARSLRSANARTEPFVYTIEGKRTELAFIKGEPVFGVDDKGKAHEMIPDAVRRVREAFAEKQTVLIDGVGLIGRLTLAKDDLGGPLDPGKAGAEAAPKRGPKAKRAAKKGAKVH